MDVVCLMDWTKGQHLDERRRRMRKAVSFSRTGFLIGVACGLAVLAVANPAARAESITISIVANGFTIPVDPLILSGATSQNYGTVDLTTLNSILTTDGSAYQFSALGGNSNWSGSPSGGTLNLFGGISIPVGGTGSTSLTITETESGFISPSGPSGTLSSSSTGNYNSASPGDSHSANSSFNAITTPTYVVATGPLSPGPDPETGSASAAIPSFVTPYTLTNSISFSLAPSASGSPSDGFGVNAKVVAAAVVPEPASVVTMMLGMPLPLLYVAWLRRRRALARVV
jgi:hypothetical protein